MRKRRLSSTRCRRYTYISAVDLWFSRDRGIRVAHATGCTAGIARKRYELTLHRSQPCTAAAIRYRASAGKRITSGVQYIYFTRSPSQR